MKKSTSQRQNNEFIKSIRKAVPNHCSNCGHKYTEKDLTLIQKDDYTAVLHLTCGSCKESYLINVVSPLGTLQGSSRMPLKIDISSAKEAKKFIGKTPVSSDDVLNAHEYLREIKLGKDLKELARGKIKSL
ncbi:hypothetical protein JW766_04595 [Candidatus Dojkabacteria bacterium]|nr:hypothetical protein [Candidatus Dojkabacteria bacterium]